MNTKIMIIEDSYTIRVLFRALLEGLDIEVVDFSSAVKALEVIDEVQPDIILLDIGMPVMNGLDFLVEFRKKSPNTPVIMISALDDIQYIQKALFLGANEYLVKPIDGHKLIKSISGYLEYELAL